MRIFVYVFSGLFNRAIIQSGTALCPWASNKNHRTFAIKTGQEFNCSIDFGTEKYLTCMQNVNSNYLAIASEKTNVRFLYFFLSRISYIIFSFTTLHF